MPAPAPRRLPHFAEEQTVEQAFQDPNTLTDGGLEA
jgi:hypothetical protein